MLSNSSVNVSITINRFDTEPTNLIIHNAPSNTLIGSIKNDHFSKDVAACNKIRFIYRGKNLDDSTKISNLESFDSTIKLIVFVTKPPVVDLTSSKSEGRIWSTFGCLTFIFILWLYKLKFSDTFNLTTNAIFYIATTLTLHTVITAAVQRTNA